MIETRYCEQGNFLIKGSGKDWRGSCRFYVITNWKKNGMKHLVRLACTGESTLEN